MSGTLALFPLIALASYLIGAIPFSYIIPRVLLGTDIRQHGSGNPGASNVSRVCGKGYGGLALLLDVGKGTLAALLAQQTGYQFLWVSSRFSVTFSTLSSGFPEGKESRLPWE